MSWVRGNTWGKTGATSSLWTPLLTSFHAAICYNIMQCKESRMWRNWLCSFTTADEQQKTSHKHLQVENEVRVPIKIFVVILVRTLFQYIIFAQPSKVIHVWRNKRLKKQTIETIKKADTCTRTILNALYIISNQNGMVFHSHSQN